MQTGYRLYIECDNFQSFLIASLDSIGDRERRKALAYAFQSFLIASYDSTYCICSKSHFKVFLSVFSYCFISISLVPFDGGDNMAEVFQSFLIASRGMPPTALYTLLLRLIFQSFLIASHVLYTGLDFGWWGSRLNLSVFSYCFTITLPSHVLVVIVIFQFFQSFLIASLAVPSGSSRTPLSTL